MALLGCIALWIAMQVVVRFYRDYAFTLETVYGSGGVRKSVRLMQWGAHLFPIGIGAVLIVFAWLQAAIAIVEAREPLLHKSEKRVYERKGR